MEEPQQKQKKKRIRRSRAEIERFEAERAEAAKKMLEAMERTVTAIKDAPPAAQPLPEVIDLEKKQEEPTEPIEAEKPKRKRVRVVEEPIQDGEPVSVAAPKKRVRPQDVLPVLENMLARKDPSYRLKFALGFAVFGAALGYSYAPNIVLASSKMI